MASPKQTGRDRGLACLGVTSRFFARKPLDHREIGGARAVGTYLDCRKRKRYSAPLEFYGLAQQAEGPAARAASTDSASCRHLLFSRNATVTAGLAGHSRRLADLRRPALCLCGKLRWVAADPGGRVLENSSHRLIWASHFFELGGHFQRSGLWHDFAHSTGLGMEARPPAVVPILRHRQQISGKEAGVNHMLNKLEAPGSGNGGSLNGP